MNGRIIMLKKKPCIYKNNGDWICASIHRSGWWVFSYDRVIAGYSTSPVLAFCNWKWHKLYVG